MFRRGKLWFAALLSGLQISPAEAANGGYYALHPSEIFILFFVMLGPLKLLGPYLKATRPLTQAELNRLSCQVAAIATVAVFAGGFLGRLLLHNWHTPLPLLILAAAIIFFLVALNIVLSQYQAPAPAAQAEPLNPATLAFPLVVTPYGLAAVIVLLSVDHPRTPLVLTLLALVMLLDLAAMLWVRWIMRGIGPLILRVLGVVLGVLQVGLALQIGYFALKKLGLPAPP